MNKPDDWIATFDAGMGVSRIDVAANTTLDLIEVTTKDATTGEARGVNFFDRVEGARLCSRVGGALDELERAAIERDDAAVPAYRCVRVCSTAGESGGWAILDALAGTIQPTRYQSTERGKELADARVAQLNRDFARNLQRDSEQPVTAGA